MPDYTGSTPAQVGDLCSGGAKQLEYQFDQWSTPNIECLVYRSSGKKLKFI